MNHSLCAIHISLGLSKPCTPYQPTQRGTELLPHPHQHLDCCSHLYVHPFLLPYIND